MADILIRDVPADVVAAREAKADEKGRTLLEDVQAILAVARAANRPLTPAERVALSKRILDGQVLAPALTPEQEIEEGLR